MKASTWVLAAAALSGTGAAIYRFALDRAAPHGLAKLHSACATAGMSLLVYAWAVVGVSRLASTALGLLVLAAVGGLATSQARRWFASAPTELLVFCHLAIAVTGFVLLLAATATAPG